MFSSHVSLWSLISFLFLTFNFVHAAPIPNPTPDHSDDYASHLVGRAPDYASLLSARSPAPPIQPDEWISTVEALKHSSNPKDWTPLSKLPAITKTAPGAAIFWTGKVKGVSVEKQAHALAVQTGGITLDMLLAKNNAVMPFYDPKKADTVNHWNTASLLFAQQASGDVRSIMGTERRPDNVFETIELKALKGNKAVRSVTKIDGANGIKSRLRREA